MSNGGLGGVSIGFNQIASTIGTAVAGSEKRKTSDDESSSKAEETSEYQVSREAFSTGKKLDVSA